MSSRNRNLEPAVPIALWLCAAAVVHFFSFKGADEVATFATERRDLRDFAASIRASARGGGASETFEVALDGPVPPLDEAPPDAATARPELPKPPERAKPDEPKPPEPEKKAIDITPVKPPDVTPPPPPPPPKQDKRVAVQQHVEDKNQADNPNAQFLGDEANHVKQESVAQITAHDRNDKEPSPGTHNNGPTEEPGNAESTRVADSDDHAGDAAHAPGERSPNKSAERQANNKVDALKPAPNAAVPPSTQQGENGTSGPKAIAQPQPAARAPAPAAADAQLPEASTAPDGSYTLNPRRSKVADATPSPSSGAAAGDAAANDVPYSIPRLGGGAGPNGRNFNLSPGGAVAAIGEKTLAAERELDGERRRSAHRGSFKMPDLKRWRAQIENYVATVKPGNTTALNTARAPFASYLNSIHNKLHPIFAEGYLDSLDRLGPSKPENRPEIHTSLEVILSKDDGRIVKMGVVATSGVTVFDSAALEAVQRASPFGKAPDAIASPDGNVYLHWEFHRNRDIACSTVNARPIMLKSAPASPVEPGPMRGPRAPVDPREQGAPSREGAAPSPMRRGTG